MMKIKTAPARAVLFLYCMFMTEVLLRVSNVAASMCDDPSLLPVNHVVIARCTGVKNPNVSGKAALTLESADICVVKGRDYADGGHETCAGSCGRTDIYYIGGRIGFVDPETGDLINRENFGQYWSNTFDPTFLSCIYQTFFSLRFFEWVSCGLGSIQRYRTNGWLDKRNRTLRYKHVNCYGTIELDFELQCE